TLLVERTGQPNLVARLSWNADTGPTDRALGLSTGTGFNEARLSLLATKRQDPLVFLGGPYYDRSFEEDGERQGDKIGMTVGAALAASPETSLRVVLDQEFDGNKEIGGLVQHGSNQTIGILTFGASMTFGAGKFLDLTIQDGLTSDAPKMAIGLGLSWRFDTPWRR
ncbi:MAG TPA: transporter, partial [Steroidobacteraceae bacterium]